MKMTKDKSGKESKNEITKKKNWNQERPKEGQNKRARETKKEQKHVSWRKGKRKIEEVKSTWG